MKTFKELLEGINVSGVKQMNDLFKKIKNYNPDKVDHRIFLKINNKLLTIDYKEDKDTGSIFMSQYGQGSKGIEYHKSINDIIKYIEKIR